MKKILFIDFARGYAIITIVLFHILSFLQLPKALGYAINFGGAGVHLFFFISGWGLGISKYQNFKLFLQRRMVKVLWPYYVIVTFIFLFNLIVPLYPDGFDAYLSHIFLYKMFVPKYEISFGFQFWFISTIIQFYLVFPVILWFFNRFKEKTVVIGALCLSAFYWIAVSFTPFSSERVVTSFFLQYLWEFVLGMAVGRLALGDKLLNQKIYVYILFTVLGVGLTGLLVLKGGEVGKLFNDIPSFVGYTSFAILIYLAVPVFRRFMIFIGGFSYTLYLIHIFIATIIWHYMPAKTSGLIFAGITFISCLTVAYLYELIKSIFQKTSKVSIPLNQ